jgi:hypothetical protein
LLLTCKNSLYILDTTHLVFCALQISLDLWPFNFVCIFFVQMVYLLMSEYFQSHKLKGMNSGHLGTRLTGYEGRKIQFLGLGCYSSPYCQGVPENLLNSPVLIFVSEDELLCL